MSFNVQRISGFAGDLNVARRVIVTSLFYTMQPEDDVVIQQGGNNVALPDGPPPSMPTLGLQHEIIADNGLPCAVNGGSHTINGLPNLTIPAGSFALILWDGTEWVATVSGSAGTGAVLQTLFNEVSVDTSTTAPPFTDLIADGVLPLALTMTIGDQHRLLAQFDTSGSTQGKDVGTLSFQLLIDGAPTRGTSFTTVNLGDGTGPEACALTYLTGPLPAGSHTASIQWGTTGGVTGQIRPASTIQEHASLCLQEIA